MYNIQDVYFIPLFLISIIAITRNETRNIMLAVYALGGYLNNSGLKCKSQGFTKKLDNRNIKIQKPAIFTVWETMTSSSPSRRGGGGSSCGWRGWNFCRITTGRGPKIQYRKISARSIGQNGVKKIRTIRKRTSAQPKNGRKIIVPPS